MTLLLMTCLQELFFRPISSNALLQTHFFRRILPDASKLQIKFLCSWTCSIRIFMNSTLIMNPVHLNKLFSKSNWWFLIPCYYQNSRGDFEKHPLFQHIQVYLTYKSRISMTCMCRVNEIFIKFYFSIRGGSHIFRSTTLWILHQYEKFLMLVEFPVHQ